MTIVPAPITYVFLDAPAPLDLPGVTWCPPARRGDIYQRLGLGYQRYVLIHGDTTQPIRRGEVRTALAWGAECWGAVGLGAIYSADLAALGMVGWGKIYQSLAAHQTTSWQLFLAAQQPATQAADLQVVWQHLHQPIRGIPPKSLELPLAAQIQQLAYLQLPTATGQPPLSLKQLWATLKQDQERWQLLTHWSKLWGYIDDLAQLRQMVPPPATIGSGHPTWQGWYHLRQSLLTEYGEVWGANLPSSNIIPLLKDWCLARGMPISTDWHHQYQWLMQVTPAAFGLPWSLPVAIAQTLYQEAYWL